MRLISANGDAPITAQALNGHVDLHVGTTVDELFPEEAEQLAAQLLEQAQTARTQQPPATSAGYWADSRPLAFDWTTPFGREDRHRDRYFNFALLLESELVDSFEQGWNVCVKLLSGRRTFSVAVPAEGMARGVLSLPGSRGELASQMVTYLGAHSELRSMLDGRYQERVFVDTVSRGGDLPAE